MKKPSMKTASRGDHLEKVYMLRVSLNVVV